MKPLIIGVQYQFFVPHKMTTPPVTSVSSTMIGTTTPFVGTNDKMEAQKGGMGIDRQES